MNKFYFGLIILLIAVISCEKEPPKPHNPVPQVLNDENPTIYDSYSKRGHGNIVDRLFEEALQNDKKLDSLTEEINHFYGYKNSQLEEYYKYSRINESYWSSVDLYVSELNDSVLKKELKEYFQTLQKQHENSVKDLTDEHEKIEKKNNMLNDQMLLMKLLVTQPMMFNYQTQKKPDVSFFEKTNQKLDSLIVKTKTYTVK